LLLATEYGKIIQTIPAIYTQSGAVKGRFAAKRNSLGFQLGNYPQQETLTIDPDLYLRREIGTFFGGEDIDKAYAVDIDNSNGIFIVGESNSNDLATAGIE